MVVEDLLSTFPNLQPDDIRPAIMGEKGSDIKLSPAARDLIPWSFECKNRESINLWQAWDQADENSCPEKGLPALIIKKNRKEPIIAIPWTAFLELIK